MATMRVVDMQHPGDAKVLFLIEQPRPTIGSKDVLIQVKAAGVNGPDIAQRKGLYPPPSGASPLLGLEVAGIIVEVGDQVQDITVGQEVCALVPGGGYAEYVKTPAAHCLSIPDGLTMEEAAALPETFFTVWHNLYDRGRLKAGETVLIHGGSGGIGSTAAQMASAMGSRVIVTAGSDEKCEACLSFGADAAINYKTHDFVDEVNKLTDGRGVDVILDMIGGEYIRRNIKSLAFEGRLVSIAFNQGAKVEVNIMTIMGKRLTWTGSTLRPQSAEVKAGIARNLEKEIWPLIDAGKIRSIIDQSYPVEHVKTAHERMESSAHIGKLVLTF